MVEQSGVCGGRHLPVPLRVESISSSRVRNLSNGRCTISRRSASGNRVFSRWRSSTARAAARGVSDRGVARADQRRRLANIRRRGLRRPEEGERPLSGVLSENLEIRNEKGADDAGDGELDSLPASTAACRGATSDSTCGQRAARPHLRGPRRIDRLGVMLHLGI